MKNKKEIWRDVPGYEDYYEASNLGRVRSLDRWVIYKNGRKQFYKGKIIEGSDVNGYKRVTLSRDNKSRNFKVSQLIVMTFLKHTPDGHTLVVDHIDGDRSNDNVDNLRIVTSRENVSTCYRANEDSFTSKFVGVSYYKQTDRWRAKIYYNEIDIHLGYYNNEEDASNAYQKALSKVNNNTFNPDEYKPSFASRYKSVYFNKDNQKWFAKPPIRGNRTFLGYHTTEEEAHQAILEYEAIQPIVKNC